MPKAITTGQKMLHTPIDEHLHRRAKVWGVAHGKEIGEVIEAALEAFLPEIIEVPDRTPELLA